MIKIEYYQLKSILIKLDHTKRYHKESQKNLTHVENSINLNNYFFISPEDDNDEEHAMHSKKDNIKIMISDKADKSIDKNF